MTSVDRTAYPRFGRVVSGRELAESFTPTDAEIEWARTRTQDEQRLLALVVWLKSYQRLGYFPKVDDVPPAVVRHVRDALGLAGNVELEQAAERLRRRSRRVGSPLSQSWERQYVAAAPDAAIYVRTLRALAGRGRRSPRVRTVRAGATAPGFSAGWR